MRTTIEILRGLREDRDLKQSDIASLIGTTQQQYSKYEMGGSDLPIRALIILADFYNVSADYLLGRTDCKDGLSALKEQVIDGTTTGGLLSSVLSLRAGGRRAVLEYVYLQRLKEKYDERK
ncbi:helix-turn-helix transcriptional regulator [Oscillibacter sp.]|uniref:helix-turn-helix domain-containing protein n=1 Tax=Oscillibacter sp. TaxID=1945593 RepID=UPI00289E7E72|nr:helix-turn-helix transcriptional regulator [Oscillibacter sp.]